MKLLLPNIKVNFVSDTYSFEVIPCLMRKDAAVKIGMEGRHDLQLPCARNIK
jgi:hypothetical protein